MATPDYYAQLGVEPAADQDTIRSAYIERARRLHPDAQSVGTIEEARRERELQALNEAWNVLKDAARRAAYDETRAKERPQEEAPPTPTTDHLDAEPEAHEMQVSPAAAMLLRFGPALVLGFVLLALLVFTAVARSGDSDDGPGDNPERCARVTGDSVVEVDCGQGNATIVAEATRADACPELSVAFAGDLPGVLWCVETTP